jgi:hypothetical protein
VITFKDSIPNFTSFHIQTSIYFKVSTGNAIYYTMQRFPRRIRVLSRRIQEANQAFEIYKDLETCLERLYTANPLFQEVSSISHSIFEQALSISA